MPTLVLKSSVPRVVAPAPRIFDVYVHDLRDIAANNISAFENPTEVKDAVDLFLLRTTS